MSSNFQEEWGRVLELIRSEVGEKRFRLWFGTVESVEFDADHFRLVFPNPFVAGLVRDRFGVVVKECIRNVLGVGAGVEFSGSIRTNPSDTERKKAPMACMGVASSSLPAKGSFLWQEFSLDTFLESESNALALKSVRHAIDFSGRPWNSLFIYGEAGSGKTHLLRGAANDVASKNRRFHALYMTGFQFASQFISALRNEKVDSFRQKCRSTDMLFLDGIEDIEGKHAVGDELLHTFNSLERLKKPLVASSRKPLSSLRGLKKSLANRLCGGLVAHVGAPEGETRLAILRAALHRMRRNLPPSTLHMIASAGMDMHAVERTLERLLRHSPLEGQDLSKSAVRRIIASEERRATELGSLELVRDAVCRIFKVLPQELVASARKAKTNLARQACMYLSRRYTEKSLREIGSFMGGRDHATVASSVRRFSDRLKGDRELEEMVERTKEALLPEVARFEEGMRW